MIRDARLEDVPTLVEMGTSFHGESPYAHLFTASPEMMKATATLLITDPDHTLFVADVEGKLLGMLGLFRYTHHISGQLAVQEVFWWVSPKARGRIGIDLLRQAERWARAVGALYLQMGAPNSRVERLYSAMGFGKMEVLYQKNL